MIVSHRHRFIFLKTRKTAGTSVELSLRPQCGPDDIVTPVTEDRAAPQCGGPRNYLHDRTGWSLADRIAWQLRERLPARVWRDYFKFTIERNPWDRQVSHYFWRMRRAGARKPSFGDYFRASAPLGNWEIYTERDALIVDKVLRYETLQADLAATTAMLGLPDLQHVARAKTSHRPRTASYRDFYDDDLRDRVARSYAREIDHFGWTF